MAVVTVPWWGKIGAKIILSRISFGYAVWQRLGLFRHGQMDTSAYAISVFNSHMEKAGLKNSLQGKIILELGPGDSIASAIIARAYGARAILVDAGAFVRSDIAPYLDLARALVQAGLTPPDLTNCSTINDILVRCDAQYMTGGLESLRQLPAATVDIIFSHAVLEHVRRNQFLDTMRECRRLLKPDGVCSHQVDLSDHLGGALNNLRFSEAVWESALFTKSGFYTNRIQFSAMLDYCRQAGFQVQVGEVRRWETLPTRRNKLAKEFRVLAEDELRVSGFGVILQ